MAMMFRDTITKQIPHKKIICHFFVVTPSSRKRKVRTESLPKLEQMMDHAGAMTVYLMASDLSFGFVMSFVWIPSPYVVPVVTSAEQMIAEICQLNDELSGSCDVNDERY